MDSRRDFLQLASTGVASLALGCAGSPLPAECPEPETPQPETPQPEPAPPEEAPELLLRGYPYDHIRPLTDGKIPVPGWNVRYQPGKIGDLNAEMLAGNSLTTEAGLLPYILAVANDGFDDYSLLPVFPLRTFRHKSIFIRTDRGIRSPEDLKGRKIATPGYSSTSLTWIRGLLQDEYGVSPNDVSWVVSSKTSDAASGNVSKYENVIPEGIKLETGPEGMDESELLVSGAVDAVFHAVEPRAFTERNPIVGRLFADSRQTEQDYFKKTGIFPAMHAVALKKSLIAEHPDLTTDLFNAYCQAKQASFKRYDKLGWALVSLPWFAQELEETREVMGKDFWPYGVAPNRKMLETLCRYAHEQGLAKRELKLEELFHPSTMQLLEP